MTEPPEDTQVWSADEVDAARRDIEEEDETGSPERVAFPVTEDEHPLESPEAVRQPRDTSGEEETGAAVATPVERPDE